MKNFKQILILPLLLIITCFFWSGNSQTVYSQPQIINDGSPDNIQNIQRENNNILNQSQQNEPENTNESLTNYQANPGSNNTFDTPGNHNNNDSLMETYEKDNPLNQLKSEIRRNNWENMNDDHTYDAYSRDNIDGEGEDDGSDVPIEPEPFFSEE